MLGAPPVTRAVGASRTAFGRRLDSIAVQRQERAAVIRQDEQKDAASAKPFRGRKSAVGKSIKGEFAEAP
jgi:hypothetical protein